MTTQYGIDAKRLLIVGCGYVGKHVVQTAQSSGHRVYALTRNPARCDELRKMEVVPIVANWLEPASLRQLPIVDWILVSVPHRIDQPVGTQNQFATGERIHAAGLDNLIQALPSGWRKLVYLSTTGVYGRDSSDWVDEETPAFPTRPGPAIAVAAEQWLQDHLPVERFTALRLAGIYGSGRVPLVHKLKQGEPLAVPLGGYLNLVHVADISRMIHIVGQRPMQRPIYVFSDGHPVNREEFYRRVAQLCGVASPVFIAPDSRDAKAQRATNKRIDPTRLVTETNFVYQYPDYTSGLGISLDH